MWCCSWICILWSLFFWVIFFVCMWRIVVLNCYKVCYVLFVMKIFICIVCICCNYKFVCNIIIVVLIGFKCDYWVVVLNVLKWKNFYVVERMWECRRWLFGVSVVWYLNEVFFDFLIVFGIGICNMEKLVLKGIVKVLEFK